MSEELIKLFVDEMNSLRGEMVQAISDLIQSKMEKSEKFEEFGQRVDRIYGTAATLGFKEISEYTKSVKDVSYMAANSNNEPGKKKAVKFLIKYIEISDIICESVTDPEKLLKIRHQLNVEKSRAELLNKKEFFSIDKKSCD